MKEMRSVTTISFDGDATLWDFEKVMRHSLAITLDELRSRLPVPTLQGRSRFGSTAMGLRIHRR